MRGIKIVDVAMKEIGYSETPKNSNKTKFGEWFGLNGVAWCGIFVSWCFDKAGFPLGNIGYRKGYAGCSTAVAHYAKTGEITKNPIKGDIVFLDFNGDKKYDHTGIFIEKIDNEHFWAIEGNTALGNDSNGGMVMRRKRSYATALFVHPKVLDELA